MPSRYVPRRGDVVRMEFDPQAGHEQSGHRPAIVVSPDAYNAKVGLALFCPITSQVKGYPYEVAIPTNPKVRGVVLADQVKSLDWQARKAKRITELPASVVKEVLGKIATLVT